MRGLTIFLLFWSLSTSGAEHSGGASIDFGSWTTPWDLFGFSETDWDALPSQEKLVYLQTLIAGQSTPRSLQRRGARQGVQDAYQRGWPPPYQDLYEKLLAENGGVVPHTRPVTRSARAADQWLDCISTEGASTTSCRQALQENSDRGKMTRAAGEVIHRYFERIQPTTLPEGHTCKAQESAFRAGFTQAASLQNSFTQRIPPELQLDQDLCARWSVRSVPARHPASSLQSTADLSAVPMSHPDQEMTQERYCSKRRNNSRRTPCFNYAARLRRTPDDAQLAEQLRCCVSGSLNARETLLAAFETDARINVQGLNEHSYQVPLKEFLKPCKEEFDKGREFTNQLCHLRECYSDFQSFSHGYRPDLPGCYYLGIEVEQERCRGEPRASIATSSASTPERAIASEPAAPIESPSRTPAAVSSTSEEAQAP